MLKKTLETQFKQAFQDSAVEIQADIFLEDPRHSEHGDYACNVCFKLAKTLKKSPKLIAEDFAEMLNKSALQEWGTVSALNGFLNIKLHDIVLRKTIKENANPTFPSDTHRYLIEYVSANPTGPLHIGHGRWAVLGSTIVNMLKFVGKTVSSEFYVNDAGNQIKLFRDSVNAIKGGKDVPDNGYHGHYIHELVQSDTDPLNEMLSQQRAVLTKVGATFDTWFSEKSLHESGELEETLNALKKNGYIYQHEGATWFKSTAFNDDKDRVLIKADGNYAYFAADIAYHKNKIDRNFDRLINIFGADHHGYVERIKASVAALLKSNYKDNQSIQILIGQLVNLFRNGNPVRMSKRSGEMITLDEVVDEIGVDATRFFLIQKSADTHVDFDLELAKKTSAENPIYYIQYAHARICSLLKKCDVPSSNSTTSPLPLETAERQLLGHLNRFPDEIYQAAQLLLPHKLANYTYDVARHFHTFYEQCPILKATAEQQESRIQLLIDTKRTFQTCLSILGISAPTSM